MSKAETRLVELSGLEPACKFLKSLDPGIFLADLDGTLRRLFYHGVKGRPGEIPQESFDRLSMLCADGWVVAVVTNQPRNGHQIARFLGSGRYQYFPDSLERAIGKQAIFGGGKDFIFPWGHYKKGGKSKKEVSAFILRNWVGGCLVMIGDKQSDSEFASDIGVDFFIKLPDSRFVEALEKLPKPFSNIVKILIP